MKVRFVAHGCFVCIVCLQNGSAIKTTTARNRVLDEKGIKRKQRETNRNSHQHSSASNESERLAREIVTRGSGFSAIPAIVGDMM